MHSRIALCLAALAAVVNAEGLFARQDDAQKSLTLLKNQVQNALFNNNDGDTEAGQVDSATSQNNFINFCATKNLPLTNGQQVKTGSCNPTVMGVILATDRLPACKFTQPDNLGVVKANTNFTVALKVTGMSMGFFVNPNKKYFAAPSDTNKDGFLLAHSHVTINKINGIDDKEPGKPLDFTFFKGLNGKNNDKGELTTVVAGGVPAGTYRLCSINTAANHQPVLGSVAQHASFDDCIYFSATDSGNDDDEAGNDNAPQQNNANTGSSNANTGSNGSGKSTSGDKSSKADAGKKSEAKGESKNKDSENIKCRAKRLRRRAAHKRRAAELERERRQRRA